MCELRSSIIVAANTYSVVFVSGLTVGAAAGIAAAMVWPVSALGYMLWPAWSYYESKNKNKNKNC